VRGHVPLQRPLECARQQPPTVPLQRHPQLALFFQTVHCCAVSFPVVLLPEHFPPCDAVEDLRPKVANPGDSAVQAIQTIPPLCWWEGPQPPLADGPLARLFHVHALLPFLLLCDARQTEPCSTRYLLRYPPASVSEKTSSRTHSPYSIHSGTLIASCTAFEAHSHANGLPGTFFVILSLVSHSIPSFAASKAYPSPAVHSLMCLVVRDHPVCSTTSLGLAKAIDSKINYLTKINYHVRARF
jgi:hypothetical protein